MAYPKDPNPFSFRRQQVVFSSVTENEDGCWIRTKGLNPTTGYTIVSLGKGKQQDAHRWVWRLFFGEIPDGLQIDHLCRVRACMNPWHLEAVPLGVNVARGNGLVGQNLRKTHCSRGHKFPTSGVLGKTRPCNECNRERQQELRDKRKAEAWTG